MSERSERTIVAKRPPERIETAMDGIVLRRHRTDDVDRLQAVIEANRDHLRPFMPWADQDRAGTAGFVERARTEWASGDGFNYLVTEAGSGDSETILGGCGLHRRVGPDAIEIGYWLRLDATGRGIATAAAGALTEAALALDGIEHVEIHCDAANTTSAAIPQRLGYTLQREEESERSAPGDSGRHQIWVSDRATA